VAKWDMFSKYVYCSTGPSLFTAAARKIVIERTCTDSSHTHTQFKSQPDSQSLSDPRGNQKGKKRLEVNSNNNVSSYRLATKDFNHEGGVFKAVFNTKADKNHYSQIKQSKGQALPNFLLEYATLNASRAAVFEYSHSVEMEGALIKGRTEKSIFVLQKVRDARTYQSLY
jgi:hypothetical protein